MNKHELSEMVIKLIGVYCFVLSLWGIITIPMAIINFQESYGINASEAISSLPMGIYHIVLFFLAYVFVRRTDFILRLLRLSTPQAEEEKAIDVTPIVQLSFWIRIIGLYYFVSSLPNVASYFTIFILSLDLSTPHQTDFISDSGEPMLIKLIMLALSLFFIFKNQYIEEMITRKKPEVI